MTLTEKLAHLADELAVLPDAQERLSTIVDRAKRQPQLPEVERVEGHRVQGCVSVVWVVGELRSGRCHFRCDAESPLVRGLVAFVCEFFSGAAPAEILAGELDPLETLGLAKNLSPTRRNGLAAVRRMIFSFARAATQ